MSADLRAERTRVMLLVAIVGCVVGCKRPSQLRTHSELEAYFPSTIGPPLGLHRLGSGGLDRPEALLLMAQLGPVELNADTATVQSSGTDMYVHFDGLRTADVIVRVPECETLPVALAARWGAGKHVKTTVVWSSPGSLWSAGYEQATCMLRFTSKYAIPIAVGAPSVLSLVRSGMTASEVAMVAPSIADGMGKEIPGISDSMMSVVYEHDRVAYSAISVPPRITAVLEERWGSPLHGADADARFWVDPETGRRATAVTSGEITNISFRDYVPWRRWLGDGQGIHVLRSSVLGATREELETAYGGAFRNDSDWGDTRPGERFEYWIEVAPTEVTPPLSSRIPLTFDDADRVKGFSFSLYYESRETRAQMLAALEAKWGARTKTTTGWEMHADGLRISIDEFREGVISVAVQRP